MRRPAYLLILVAVAGLALTAHAADPNDDAPALVATGDFNGDGIADLVQASAAQQGGSATLTVRLGRPGGSFTALPSIALTGQNPHAIAVGDFNHDGKLDVIVGDASGALLEFQGDGQGGLHSTGNIASVGSVVSIAAGRFTKDDKPGLVVSDMASNTAAILLGSGDGSFRVAWSFELPKRGTEFHIATADFNKDGIADLVITTEDSDDYEVMLGNGNGTFTYAPQLSHLKDPNSYCPT